MSFVDVVAVERFTNGRLGRDDPATLRQLEIALAAVRHWCGWHIAPVQTVELTLDGPGGKLLVLPTLNVRSVTRVTECGEYLDLGDITWSANGRVAKRSAKSVPAARPSIRSGDPSANEAVVILERSWPFLRRSAPAPRAASPPTAVSMRTAGRAGTARRRWIRSAAPTSG